MFSLPIPLLGLFYEFLYPSSLAQLWIFMLRTISRIVIKHSTDNETDSPSSCSFHSYLMHGIYFSRDIYLTYCFFNCETLNRIFRFPQLSICNHFLFIIQCVCVLAS